MKSSLFFLIWIVLLLAGLAESATQEWFYQQTIQDKQSIVSYQLETNPDNKQIKFIILAPDKYSEHICDENYTSQIWQLIAYNQGTSITAQRKGSTVEIQGQLAGNPIKKSLILTRDTWFQSFDIGLIGIIRAQKSQAEFWAIRPDDLSGFTFSARQLNSEWLEINGQQENAIRFHVALSGLLSLFWGGADFWFRKNDLVLLQSVIQDGPGYPKTTLELIVAETQDRNSEPSPPNRIEK